MSDVTPPTARLTAAAVPCTSDLDLTLTSRTVTAAETHRACDTVTAGPAVTVTATGELTLRAGTRIVLTDGFRVFWLDKTRVLCPEKIRFCLELLQGLGQEDRI